MTDQYVVDLRDADATQVALVGGKGAGLGALTRIEDVRVPAGFCVSTKAFREAMARVSSFDAHLDRLSHLNPADQEGIRAAGAQIRRAIEETPLPADLAATIIRRLVSGDERAAYAVRSSATAEDLSTASFAGQHDSYVNAVGVTPVLQSIRRCWASLFTDRAITYRLRHGVDHRSVLMAVVVQEMVVPDASGVLFTADPVTGNRRVATVDAGFGLGEALVSGRLTPDTFRVREDEIISRDIAVNERALYAPPGGGTQEVEVAPPRQGRPSLTDDQVVRLARLGRRLEAHFGSPLDIEWCLVGEDFLIVQSRPITTLFPVPQAVDEGIHVYVSVGHQQMMTDPMKPLGWSMWQLTAMAPMHEAGGRLFVDVAERLASPASRDALLDIMGKGDPLVRDALETVIGRDLVPMRPADAPDTPAPSAAGPSAPPAPAADPTPAPAASDALNAPADVDPAILPELIARSETSIAALRKELHGQTGPALFDQLAKAFAEHKRVLADPLSMRAIMAGMEATWWLNDRLQEWLGEKNAADTLTLSAPGNVTSEMGLALLDVADAIRPHPQVAAFLQGAPGDDFLHELPRFPGGQEARDAIEGYLDRYGMRCAGEIDITRARWRERPATLVPLLLEHVRNHEPGAAARRFAHGQQQAQQKADEVLHRLRPLPDGDRKANETERMIAQVRGFVGYREYPKYDIVRRYDLYKQALLAEAERLTQAGVLAESADAFYLTFQEFHEVARTHRADARLIQERKDQFRHHHSLKPPRVLTSEGETFTGTYRRDDAPPDALIGLAVSAGTVEGRARVIVDMAQAELAPGDILVTTYTDPSWTPLFVAVAGLVTEVGGVMTHGAVIAREYGLPAVVGVVDATRRIADGQRIRVHGSEGYVEILPAPD